MAEHLKFYFDPVCPWSYQTSRWIRHLVRLGEVEADWGLFSLEAQNRDGESEDLARSHSRSALALRTAAAVREVAGSPAVGTLYGCLGQRFFERGEPLEKLGTVQAALADAGLDPALAVRARDDHSLWDSVLYEQRALIERTGSFGVPTIVLDAGTGPAIFGPVVSEVPATDAEAVELLTHVVWLVRYESFSELKRERSRSPDLAAVRTGRLAP